LQHCNNSIVIIHFNYYYYFLKYFCRTPFKLLYSLIVLDDIVGDKESKERIAWTEQFCQTGGASFISDLLLSSYVYLFIYFYFHFLFYLCEIF